MAKKPLRSIPVTRAVFSTNLPASHCREIGRIITRWAYLESHVQHTLQKLLGLSDQEARLVLREAKLEERLSIIADVAHLYGLKVDETTLLSMKKDIDGPLEKRNLMAHGAWSYDANHQRWAVTQTKGTWEDQDAPKTERKKKINPEGLLTDVDTMRKTVLQIDALIAQAKKLRGSLLKQIEAWRDAPPSSSDGLAYERARRLDSRPT
jgi:hypothetical protein